MSGSLAKVDLPAAVSSGVYNAGNRLTSWAGSTFSYDLNGNLTGDGTNTYSWDARNQLSSISGGVSASFGYDGVGRRKSKTIASSQTGFVYDGLNFVQELTGSTVTANLMTGGLDEVFQRKEATATRYPITNALGSVIALTDGPGALATEYSFEPYGKATTSGAADNNSQSFTAREDDGTGLFYYRARYYMPGCGRFISEDPIGLASGQSNSYAYVGGDPIQLVDPSGLRPGDSFCTVDAAGVDAAKYANPRSKSEGREYASWIYKEFFRERYTYDEPKQLGSAGGFMPSQPIFHSVVGMMHTHGAKKPGYLNDDFSGTDKRTADQLNIPSYLGNPSDEVKKYTPNLGKPLRGPVENLTNSPGGSGC